MFRAAGCGGQIACCGCVDPRRWRTAWRILLNPVLNSFADYAARSLFTSAFRMRSAASAAGCRFCSFFLTGAVVPKLFRQPHRRLLRPCWCSRVFWRSTASRGYYAAPCVGDDTTPVAWSVLARRAQTCQSLHEKQRSDSHFQCRPTFTICERFRIHTTANNALAPCISRDRGDLKSKPDFTCSTL